MNLALYREFRPKTFEEVVGQNHITRTLANQVKNNNITHAYLFTGARGTGKTSCAKIFSKAINCLNPQNGSPCGVCENCKALNEINTDILEIDAASNNRVDEIRDLRERVKYPPTVAKKKVYIIDEVHMLTESAFNALLKTLEEPPAYVVFILATTEVHKLPATILSRCTRFDFRLLSVEELVEQLRKVFSSRQVKFDEESLYIIARQGEGSVRDTLSIADSVMAYCENNITVEKTLDVLGLSSTNAVTNIVRAIGENDIQGVFVGVKNAISTGKNLSVLCKEMTEYFKNLLLINQGVTDFNLLNIMPTDLETYKQTATMFDVNQLRTAFEKLSRIELDLKFSLNPQNLIEAVCVSLMNNGQSSNVQPIQPIKANGYAQQTSQNMTNPLNSSTQPQTTNQISTQPQPTNQIDTQTQMSNQINTQTETKKLEANLQTNNIKPANANLETINNNFQGVNASQNINGLTTTSIPDDIFSTSASNSQVTKSVDNAGRLWGEVLIKVKEKNMFAFSASLKNIYGVETKDDTLILHTNDKTVYQTVDDQDKKVVLLNILKELNSPISHINVVYDENNKSQADIIKSLKETFLDKLKVKE